MSEDTTDNLEMIKVRVSGPVLRWNITMEMRINFKIQFVPLHLNILKQEKRSQKAEVGLPLFYLPNNDISVSTTSDESILLQILHHLQHHIPAKPTKFLAVQLPARRNKYTCTCTVHVHV